MKYLFYILFITRPIILFEFIFIMVSSHDFIQDKRNKNIKIYINGRFYQRSKAKQKSARFDEGLVWKIFNQIASALNHMH